VVLPDQASLEEVCMALKSGECVALPTETVYGLAADALSAVAPRKIFEIKGRPLIDPLIVHVLGRSQADLVAIVPPEAEILIEAFWPGPLTLIMKKRPHVPDLVTSGLDTVAVRSPSHPVFRQVLEMSGLCLAAPSANPFGYISPTKAEHVSRHLGDRLALVVDGGPCQHGVESTIVDLSQGNFRILRPGPISQAQMESVLGKPVEMSLQHAPRTSTALKAAGTLARHYSPATPCHLVSYFVRTDSKVARVWLKHPEERLLKNPLFQGEHFWLSESGSIEEQLKNVYDLLHRMDQKGFSCIEIEDPGPDPGRITLRDRLGRACWIEG